jgi:hypothetical protein
METRTISLETSWPSIYHDLIADGMAVCRRPVSLRTQTKNAARESDKFSPRHPLMRAGLRISYTGQQVLQSRSQTVLEVMCNVTGTDFAQADYRLPVPPSWDNALDAALGPLPDSARRRPWLVYRPLVARPEWRGSVARNADPEAYAAIFNSIRDKFFVVSVADLGHGQEQIVGPDAKPDLSFHEGELVFEALAALYKRADLVFTSSGFSAILGPSVGTPTISIGGGYEDYRCHDSGIRFAPYLSIGPINGCTCWHSGCRLVCDKTIDIDAAKASVAKFLSENCIQISDRPCADM